MIRGCRRYNRTSVWDYDVNHITFLEQQKFVFSSRWTTEGRKDDGYLFWGEVAITECVLGVTLSEGMLLFDSHAGMETEGLGTNHGRIMLWFGPYSIFVIA